MTINNHACNRTAGKLPFSRRLDEPLSCPQWQLRSVDHRQRWRAGGDLPSLRCHAFRSNGSSSRRQPVEQAVHRLSLSLPAWLIGALGRGSTPPLASPRWEFVLRCLSLLQQASHTTSNHLHSICLQRRSHHAASR